MPLLGGRRARICRDPRHHADERSHRPLVMEDAPMPEAPSSDTVRRMLLRLAERVIDRTAWPEWRVDDVPASHVHGAEVILVFASPKDLTVEEVAVTVEQLMVSGGWVVDAID